MVNCIISIYSDTEDYTAVQGTLVFGPSDVQLSIPINVSMDGIFEDTESFSVSLSVPANETGVILGPSTATINIIDCDSKFSFIQSVVHVSMHVYQPWFSLPGAHEPPKVERRVLTHIHLLCELLSNGSYA